MKSLILTWRNIDEQSIENYIPFWRLKLKSEEYKKLKTELKTAILLNKCVCPLDIWIYISEWWRREYDGGSCETGICDSIGIQEQFFREICRNVDKNEHIQIYQTGRGRERLYSLCFQGGLPLNLIIQQQDNNQTGYWRNLLVGLSRYVEIGDTNKVIASQSNELALFCETMTNAYERGNFEDMPFYCEGSNDEFYCNIIQIMQNQRERLSRETPFTLKWKLEVDDIAKTISVRCLIKGSSRVSTNFLESHNLRNHWSIKIIVDDQIKKTFNYLGEKQSFLSQNKFEIEYEDGQTIILKTSENENLLVEQLSFLEIPHIIYSEDGYNFSFENKANCQKYCIIPDVWEIEGYEITNDKLYSCSNEKVRIIQLKDDVSIKNKETGESRTISSQNVLSRTMFVGISGDTFVEPIVCTQRNLRNLFRIETEGGARQVRNNEQIKYQKKGSKEWFDEIPQGLIRAKIDNGNIVVPTNWFIYLNSFPQCEILEKEEGACKIRFVWEEGEVKPDTAKLVTCSRNEDDSWSIIKSDGDMIGVIPLVCRLNDGSVFPLHMYAPYNKMTISYNNLSITNGSIIPLEDIASYIVSNVDGYIRISIKNGNYHTIRVDRMMSLYDVISQTCNLQQEYDKTLTNLTETKVNVRMSHYGHRISFDIMQFPYRIEQYPNSEKEFRVKTADGHAVANYKDTLMAVSFLDPKESEIIEVENGDGKIPDGLGTALYLSNYRGYILPGKLPKDNGVRLEDYIEKVGDRMIQEPLTSENWKRVLAWWNRYADGIIPASSIWDMLLIAKKKIFLWRFVFLLWSKYPEYKTGRLIKDLLKLQNQLSFDWWWLESIDFSDVISLNEENESVFNTALKYHSNNENEEFFENWQELCENWSNFVDSLRLKSFVLENDIDNYIDCESILNTTNTMKFEGSGNLVDAPNIGMSQKDLINILIEQRSNILEVTDSVRRAIQYYHRYNWFDFIVDYNNQVIDRRNNI